MKRVCFPRSRAERARAAVAQGAQRGGAAARSERTSPLDNREGVKIEYRFTLFVLL